MKGWLSDDQKWYWLDKTTGTMFAGGWKQIDGKQYYFYADGSMAVNTVIDGKTMPTTQNSSPATQIGRASCRERV